MSTWPVRNEQDRETVVRIIRKREKLPFTVSLRAGAPRTIEQNKLQRKWMLELEEQGDQTAEEYRGLCKAYFGVPILLAENEEFADKYNRIIRPLNYEQKLEIMQEPIDFPVTRLMTTKQKTKYLDAVYKHFVQQGFYLTIPQQ